MAKDPDALIMRVGTIPGPMVAGALAGAGTIPAPSWFGPRLGPGPTVVNRLCCTRFSSVKFRFEKFRPFVKFFGTRFRRRKIVHNKGDFSPLAA